MNSSANPGLLGKLTGIVIMAAIMAVGLMFSMIALVLMLVIGTLAFGYFWWKTRALRHAMKTQAAGAKSNGQVFEGEAVVIEEWQERQSQPLPVDPGSPSSEMTSPDGGGKA